MTSFQITPVEMVSDVKFVGAIAQISLDPPTLTRLEPQSVSGDPAPGATAVMADPLWMIGPPGIPAT